MCFSVQYIVRLFIAFSILTGLVAFCRPALSESTKAKGSAASNRQSGNQVIFRVGKRTFTRKFLELGLRRFSRRGKIKLTDKELTPIVQPLIEQTLFAEEARAIGLDKDEKVQFFIQDIVDRILANLYVRRYVLRDVRVSESEIVEYYKSHTGLWRRPEMVHARHILLRVNPMATADEIRAVEKKAWEIKRRLDAGESFENLAKKYSEDTGTKDKGGDLGFFSRNGKVPAISNKVFAMQPGEISDPVRSSVGYHILQVIERRKAGLKSLEEVRGEIRSQLLRKKQRMAIKMARKRLARKFNLYVNKKFLVKGEKSEP